MAAQWHYLNRGTLIVTIKFCIVSKFTTLFADHQDVSVYADLNGFRFNESSQEIIPSTVLITPYRPDLILYNSHSSLMGIIELTCPLDSRQHLESAHCRKQQKPEYLQLLAELDRLNIANYYSTVEVSVLCHYLPDPVNALKDVVFFTDQDLLFSKASVRAVLNEMAWASISASQRIFLGRTVKNGLSTQTD